MKIEASHCLPQGLIIILPHFINTCIDVGTSLLAQLVKNPPAMQETPVPFLGQEDPLEEGQSTHSSIIGLPWCLGQERIHLQCGRHGFDPWVQKIFWRRAWQPILVFLPREFPWTEEPGRLQSMGCRVRHNRATKHSTAHIWGRQSTCLSTQGHQGAGGKPSAFVEKLLILYISPPSLDKVLGWPKSVSGQ